MFCKLFNWFGCCRNRKVERDARRTLNFVERYIEDEDYGSVGEPVGPVRELALPNGVVHRRTHEHNFETSHVTLEIAAAIKLRLGLMDKTELNVRAARQEGLDFIRRKMKTDPRWEDLRIAHQQMHLTYAVHLAFVPSQGEIHAAALARSKAWRKASKRMKKGPRSCNPFCFLPLWTPSQPRRARLRLTQPVQP
jgi:hypothetical protein